MASQEYDLGYLHAALPVLERYLMSPDVYWSLAATPPPGYPAYPQLTLGNLLLTQRRSVTRQDTPDRQGEQDRLERELSAVQFRWKVAWEKKATREFSARLRLWNNFLEEYRNDPEDNVDRYSYEVSRRVMLTLLDPEASIAPTVEHELLAGLDGLLRTAFISGDFIWERDIASGFPTDQFWYLYGKLRSD